MAYALITASIDIAASPATVWEALVDPVKGRLWRGADFATDWQPGSAISITPDIGPRRYRDKGRVLQVDRPTILAYEFLPRMSGLPDLPENYSVVTARLVPTMTGTRVEIEHSVPPSPIRRGKDYEIGPESGQKHVAFYWRGTLPILRDLVERRERPALQMAVGRLAEQPPG
jgi:uncharacterized protein YndB with AHSA1/START domain